MYNHCFQKFRFSNNILKKQIVNWKRKLVNMMISNKDELQNIENAMAAIKSGDHEGGAKSLSASISSILNKHVEVSVVPNSNSKQFFAMCIIPEESTISKIISSISSNKGNLQTIQSLWKKTKNWRMQIDEGILTPRFSPQELTAIALHECGHVIQTNSVPSRINSIIQFQIATFSAKDRTMLRGKSFSKFLELPIIQACTCSDPTGIRKEMKADKFAAKCGYTNELMSAITKMEEIAGRNLATDSSVKKATDFSMNAMNSLEQRKAKLVKGHLGALALKLPNNFMKESVLDLMELMSSDERVIYEMVDGTIDTFYYTEFLNIGKKKLTPVTQAQIDYIRARMQDMKTNDDRVMLITYANSKLDLCNYYLDIYKNPELSKKFIIPNTERQLLSFQQQLNDIREEIIKKGLVKDNDFVVFYPSGYEG